MPTHEMILLLLIFRLNLHKVEIVLFSSPIFSMGSQLNAHTPTDTHCCHGSWLMGHGIQLKRNTKKMNESAEWHARDREWNGKMPEMNSTATFQWQETKWMESLSWCVCRRLCVIESKRSHATEVRGITSIKLMGFCSIARCTIH